jgi:hypothetical protein
MGQMCMKKFPFVKIPQLNIKMHILRKLQLYIETCPVEISGLGNIEVYSPEELMITDIFILKQNATAVSTTLDTDAIAEFLTIGVEKSDELTNIRCWWHSHVNMDVFFSPLDENTISCFTGDFLVSVVGNKRGEFLSRLDIFQPLRLSLDIPFRCMEEEEIRKCVEDEINHKLCIPEVSSFRREHSWLLKRRDP